MIDKTFGDCIYRYTIQGQDVIVHEGVIKEFKGVKCVYFQEDNSWNRYTGRFEEIRANGPYLWLPERDDELAKALFIELYQQKIFEHEKIINDYSKMIELLAKDRL